MYDTGEPAFDQRGLELLLELPPPPLLLKLATLLPDEKYDEP